MMENAGKWKMMKTGCNPQITLNYRFQTTTLICIGKFYQNP